MHRLVWELFGSLDTRAQCSQQAAVTLEEGQDSGDVGTRSVSLLFGQPGDVGLQVGHRVVDGFHAKPSRPGRHEVEAPVVVRLDLAHLRHTADVGGLCQRLRVYLMPLRDGHDAELTLLLWPVEQVAYQLAIALLEDVQRKHKSGKQHGPDREKGDSLVHAISLVVRQRRLCWLGSARGRPAGAGKLVTVLSRIDLRGSMPSDPSDLRGMLPRAAVDVDHALDDVRPICESVRDRGAAAVQELTARFDGVDSESARVPVGALDEGLARLDPGVRSALEEMIRRTRLVHREQLREDAVAQVSVGATVTERWVPVRRTGLYAPGGLVVYPSSVVMSAVPAQVAGVDSVAVASPPQREHDGLPHPAVLAACALLGVDEVYAVGGAQAVAMFAYGTEECSPVDIVTGPGNVYVAAAKRALRGRISIDSEAGPTEIAVLADETADPAYVAADLIAQAEHDELAACLLVTDSGALADQVDVELGTQVPDTRHRERVETALAGQSAYVLTDDIGTSLRVTDAWAPEHLQVLTEDASAVARRVRNAGAVFVGPHAPVSLGDYLAGSNHVLPTGGTARHSGGLSVQSFLRGMHVVEYNHDALAEAAPHIAALGAAEDLGAHVDAVSVRVGETGAGRS